jgi:hypothetical protein
MNAKEERMDKQPTSLRERYTFIDFLYYTTLLAVPLFTALYAAWKRSTGWMIFYIVLCAAAVAVIYRFYCTHCPHYTREGRTTRCMFFWGMPKFFRSRPGPLRLLDKTVAVVMPIILVIFPLYWLSRQLGLMIIFILSLIAFFSTVRRNECRRCIYVDCPVNKTPEDMKSHDDVA